jgi:hypothetical protein
MKGHKPGGGIASRVNVSPPVRTGSGGHSARPAGVSQLGYAVGDHSTHRPGSTGYRGEKLHNPERNFNPPVKFGNEVAGNVGKGGPGTGRTTYHCGTQSTHGPTAPGNPPAKNHDILRDFGPDYRK